MKKHFFIVLFLCFGYVVKAQTNTSVQMVTEYFQNHEFDKAAVIYQDLFDQTGSKTYFDFLIECYIETKQFNEAEKAIKKQIKHNPSDLSFQVLLAKTYIAEGLPEKAQQLYTKTIEKLPKDIEQIKSFGDALEKENDYDNALLVYKKGQSLVGDEYPFYSEIANIYLFKHDYVRMIEAYFGLLKDNSYLDVIEQKIQGIVANDRENTAAQIIMNSLIQEVQKRPNNIALSELLIWLCIQERDFQTAFIHSIALDKRLNENGNRLINLGDISLANNNYDVAIASYNYVKEKGTDNQYFQEADIKAIIALNRKILQNPKHTKLEELNLEKMLTETVRKNENNRQAPSLLIDLAHLQCYYLQKADTAIFLLETALENQAFSQNDKADIRMELGDIYLFNDDIWDANLVYAKIETDKEGTPIANLAKFKRAKTAYYLGDFKWAAALLDILKAATSKETSNDAFELSLTINDNTQDDTVASAMQMFARADYFAYRQKFDEAMKTYDSIPKQFPGNQLEDDILFRKAQLNDQLQKYDSAVVCLQQIIERFSYDMYADNALFMLGDIYESKLNNKGKAMDAYKKLLSDYSGSIFTFEARTRFRTLRGDTTK